MVTYELITGEVVDLAGLTEAEREFLQRLSADATAGVDYFELLRRVKGPDAVPLRGGPITPAIARSALYRAAHDVADRVGIEQGYLLAPDVDTSGVERGDDLVSMTEAAGLIGISRPATHQALVEGRLRGQRVGNAWIVRRADAESFKDQRSTRGASSSSGTGAAGARVARGSGR